VPVYEYRCESGHHYEKTEGFNAPREQACTVCGQIARRQISLPAVIFKGPGFYSTDNRGTSRAGSNGNSSESDKSTTSSGGHGHSHGDGGHSHGRDSATKAEAKTGD
jgi:putative FmdB family regulatory protein